MSDDYKEYLSDGVYAEFDGFQIWLTTLQGMRIALEHEVMRALFSYEERLMAKLLAEGNTRETTA